MISFVVPAHDEAELIGASLASIHAAARSPSNRAEPYEIVVVDDASTDDTARIAEELGARVVRIARRQIAASRNAGAAAARGEMLIFVDADTRVDERVVRDALDAVRRGAIGGSAVVRFDGAVPVYARVMMPGLLFVSRVFRLAFGCFVFATRSAFDAAGGFDEELYAAEEIALSRALRKHGRFVVLRAPVTTSARKLRSHSMREVVGTLFGIAVRGKSAVRDRKTLDLWYGPRRKDPGATT